ncbi:hypothetical protein ACHAXR_000818 [Thalassiosira sp. AJA248-18]
MFKTQEEVSYLNETMSNNDPIWMYTVVEAFIGTGDNEPTKYLEFEVSPTNQLWTGRIQHNPNKNWTSEATASIDDWGTYPIAASASTSQNVDAQT